MKTNRNNLISAFLFLSFSAFICNSVFAQNVNTNNSTQEFKFSFQERVRIETWDNAVTLSSAAKAGNSYLRNRTSLMGQWFPTESLEVAAKLTNEFRTYMAPSTNHFHMSELFIDQLYVKWNTASFLDGTLTLGRQNITLGEGFVVMDGSPLDGSRSTYFNAVRYDWNISKEHTLTFLGLYQPKEDELPVLNGNDIDHSAQGDGTWKLSEQKETGLGVYYTGKFSWGNLQSYFIRKNYVDPNKTWAQMDADVNTLGSRINASFSKEFSFTFEGAYQFGSLGDYNKNAYGGYLYLDYKPGWSANFLPKTFTIGTICLSGDDPGTADNEGWDPVFSRWPKWSESYIYTQIQEFGGRVAYWSNLVSLYASLKFVFDEQISYNFDYHHMTAPHSYKSFPVYVSGSGSTRGDLFISKLLVDINKNLTGHFIFEHFIPGDYYFGGAESSNWARMEFMIKL